MNLRLISRLRYHALPAILAGLLRVAAAPEPLWVSLPGPPVAAAGTPPLAYWVEAWTTPRPVRFHFFRVDLRDPGLELCAVIAPDPDGDGPAEARLESPLKLAAEAGVTAAINANAFLHLPTASDFERARGWFKGKHVDIAGLAVADGAPRSLPDMDLPSVWVDTEGRLRIGSPENLEAVRQGVCSWIDRLLENGAVVARPNQQCHPRTLVGTDAEGKTVLLVVADGRQKGYSEGISLTEAAEVMKQHGCYHAANLDGGGSSILLARPATDPAGDMVILNRPSDGRPRPVPVLLAVRRRASL